MNKKIIKWLKDNGFTFEEVRMTDGKPALMVDTDYDGPYPTKETFRKQHEILKKVSRYKRLKTEPRGYCTAMLIAEA